ncbi:5-formyltetrahydrofolate cyclo-ligase [Cladophialophora bantiana CBS 173.52]|uniref:5-formyltetrahydrofolate cyclo-ligase n=1 Tax=Cladophialophora bantiana (strain ATCC 10958 / CBS 173.52 / CDC B-1940 / NIH 8579) TaxID=1442370 RepID=A0A0D2INI4_CLAB1|nr:5-formyltetrahydrofolate cyclo-ligase [Cladophialophora bantiana CBS 173.52]KIW98329.1 5-formyltetrahydrofolate cyclo-ligase [Cladophialophora bantiana CBS 173.52]
MALKDQKAALRKSVGEELKKLDSKEIEKQSAIITEHVLQMPAYQKAKSMAIFLSMPGREVSTRDIVLHALDSGKSVFVPYLHAGEAPKSKVMDMLQLQDKDDFHSLNPDAWGIPSLSKDSVERRSNALGGIGIWNRSSEDQQDPPTLDLVFMPAVAFDQSHRRLGHGKGFYDRYLSKYKDTLARSQSGRPMPLLVGIALRQQVLLPGETIPADDHDWTVDQIVVADVE